MKKSAIAVLLAAAIPAACSDGERKEKRPLWKEERKAMDKAGQAEDTLLDAAEAQRRRIEEESR